MRARELGSKVTIVIGYGRTDEDKRLKLYEDGEVDYDD